MKRTFTLAFIGGSIHSIAGYPHLIASQMDGHFRVVAGAFSRDPATNRKTAEAWNISRVYDDWRALIDAERDRVDAFVVLTPTPLHREIIATLLQHGLPVICEKALVSSREELDEIASLYDPDRHFLVVTNNYSGYPMVRELRQKIESGVLGRILNIRLQMPQESFLRPPKSVRYPQPWRLKDGYIPAIALDLGAHLHHLAYFLLGREPSEVIASYRSFSSYGVIDDATMMLKYSDTLVGHFWISKTALGHRNGLAVEVYGERGSAYWRQENPEKLELAYQNGERVTIDRGSDLLIENRPAYNRMTPGHPAGFIEAFANIYQDIATALTAFSGGKSKHEAPVFGLEHAANGIDLLHAASASNAANAWKSI